MYRLNIKSHPMKTIFAIILLFFSLSTFAQKSSYSIEIKLDNYPDSVLYLVNYYGTTNQLKDTAELDKGKFIFEGNEKLPGGIYLVVTKARSYFELLVDQEQKFSVQTDYNDFVTGAKFSGSNDNAMFYEYLNFLGKKDKERKAINKEYEGKSDDEAAQKELQKKLTKINDEVSEYKDAIINKHPNSFLTAILKASKEPEIPTELPQKEDGTPDSSYIYRYYKNHYFDGFDLADERLLRTPIYANRVKQYFKKVIVQHPDTLIKEADHIIALSKPNKETYKFTIWYFTYETETSQIMGMDAVFVHLVNKYYKTGEAYWVNERVLKNITERADVLDKLLIGRPGPNMIMIDTNNNLKALYSLQADYTIIMFWDPDCGHCRTEIPEIRDWLKENEAIYNAKIFSVCSDTNLVKWKKFLHDYEITHWDNVNGTRSATKNYHDLYDIISTPTIYLLDKDKNILAKRLGYKQLIAFIERNHKLKSQKDNKD
jgi:thiol-disulfide isomerase/thioredoxin